MTQNIDFMRELEEEYRQVSGLKNRSEYKIFYGQIFPAPILTLGLNPAGTPEGTSEDGTRQSDGSPASSSSSYFENMENDIIDCDWRENTGLRKLLLPLVGLDHDRFRNEIVKTNIAFRRSKIVKDIDLVLAEQEAVPFIERIIARVSPEVIILTGPNLGRFLELYALNERLLTETVKAPGINHVVLAASLARLRSVDRETLVIQVAHASQFAWTYERYSVSATITELMGRAIAQGGASESGVQRTFGSRPTSSPANLFNRQSAEPHVMPKTQFSDPRLGVLESAWLDLQISPQFHRVHHFASNKFSGKRERLDSFIAWCEIREIKDENSQTLERALDVARRVKDGQNFDQALEQAWAARPVVTR